jgi:hypothetical protein
LRIERPRYDNADFDIQKQLNVRAGGFRCFADVDLL